jgi:hypothetical protein
MIVVSVPITINMDIGRRHLGEDLEYILELLSSQYVWSRWNFNEVWRSYSSRGGDTLMKTIFKTSSIRTIPIHNKRGDILP